MPAISNIKYEKRERPAPTSTNPTLTQLMGARDRSNWVEVEIPIADPAYDISFQAIYLNHQKFEPGQKYTVPPIVAEELRTSIRNFNESIVLQHRKAGQHKKAELLQMQETDLGDLD